MSSVLWYVVSSKLLEHKRSAGEKTRSVPLFCSYNSLTSSVIIVILVLKNFLVIYIDNITVVEDHTNGFNIAHY